jgi:hypothetical protein
MRVSGMSELAHAQSQVEARLQRVNAAIDAIKVLAAESDEPLIEPPPMLADEEKGFTDRVREVLKANSLKRLTALEIRDVILKSSPKDDPKIVLIHIHNTLKRLHKQEEVEETRISDGRNAYQWKGTTQNAWSDLIIAAGKIAGIPAGVPVPSRKSLGQMIAEGATSNDSAIPRTSAEAKKRLGK